MNAIEIIMLIIFSPFIIGSALCGLASLVYGLGFVVAIILEQFGIKVPSIEPKILCVLGTFVGIPLFFVVSVIVNIIEWLGTGFIVIMLLIIVVFRHIHNKKL